MAGPGVDSMFAAMPVAGSCGSAVWLVNTYCDLQGFAAEPGRPSFDFDFDFKFNDNVTGYAVAQLPVYQYVNGTQLTAAWSAIGGVSVRF